MKELARVVAVEDGGLWVETQRSSTCNSCAVQKGCGQGLMAKMMPGKEHYLWVVVQDANKPSVSVGDQVEISVPDDVILKASLIVYLVPLLAFIVGVITGNHLSPGDAGAIGGGVVGMLVGLGVVRLHATRVKHDARVQPRLLRILPAVSKADSLAARVI